MADCDAAGIIYYASPLRWAERLFGEWLAAAGHPISSMLTAGVATPAVDVQVSYRSPLGLDDQVELEFRAERIGRTTFTTRCDALREGDHSLAVEVHSTFVYARFAAPGPAGTEATIEPTTLPDWLVQALTSPVGIS